MRTRLLIVGASLAILCLLTALITDVWHAPESPSSTEQPDDCRPGVLRIGVREKLTPVNPLTVRGSYSAVLTNFLFDGLMRFGTDGELTYNLAESHKTQDDGKVYLFSLRPGIKFHDGDDLTAEDVVFSYKAYRDGLMKATLRCDHLRYLKDIIAVDQNTVRFTFTQPTPAFISTSSMYEILPKHILSDATNRDSFGRKPIGSGPFVFESWRADGGVVLKANRHYHQVSPKLTSIVVKVIPNEEGRWQAFVLNAIDMLDFATDNVADQLCDSGLARTVLVPQNLAYALFLSPKLPPTNNLAIRETILDSIDVEQACKHLTKHKYRPNYSSFSDRRITLRPRERTAEPSQEFISISLSIDSRDERQRDIALALRQQLNVSGFRLSITDSQQVHTSSRDAFNAYLVAIPSVYVPARMHASYWSQHILGPGKLIEKIESVTDVYEETKRDRALLKKELLRIENQLLERGLAIPFAVPLYPFIYSPRICGDFQGYFRSFCSAAAVLNWQAN